MKKIILSLLLSLSVASIFACTSVIISGKRTENGKPLMIKNRDTDCLDNRLARFQNDSIAFIGLVNAPVDSGEVWAGINNYGFAIMNTATYNFNEDSLTAVYKGSILLHQKDSALYADSIAAIEYDSVQLKKMTDKIYADTQRVHMGRHLEALRYTYAAEVRALDSINNLLAIWTDSITRHPEVLPVIDLEDQEGVVMFKALERCKSVPEFLALLDSLPHPLGIQTNFGVIDTLGNAIYVEANNWRYVVYDVNEEGNGYRVQTNFAFAGNAEGYKGWERYLTTEAIMKDLNDHFTHQPINVGHQWMFNHISRSFRHEILGYPENYCPPSGVTVDQDFIPRRITSAAVVFEGPVMWSLLGYPACGVALPAMVCDQDRLPAAVKRTEADSTCLMSNMAMQVKMDYVFPDPISNGRHYVRIGNIVRGQKKKPALKDCTMKAENTINKQFYSIYNRWTQGKMTDQQFYDAYERLVNTFPNVYVRNFRKFLVLNKEAETPVVVEEAEAPAAEEVIPAEGTTAEETPAETTTTEETIQK